MNKELKVYEQKAQEAYNNADASGKKLLEDLYGKETFHKNIMDRVKTFADACNITRLYPHLGNISKDEIAYKKLKIIAKALNEGWVPDWSNTNEGKYYPWMKFAAGSGFAYLDYDYVRTHTYVSSRLCYKSQELAEYAGKQFQDIYNDFLN